MFTLSSRPTRTKTGLSRDHRLGRFNGIRETFYISSLQGRRLLTETKRYIDRSCHFEKPRKRLREEGRGGEKNHFPFYAFVLFSFTGHFSASWGKPYQVGKLKRSSQQDRRKRGALRYRAGFVHFFCCKIQGLFKNFQGPQFQISRTLFITLRTGSK